MSAYLLAIFLRMRRMIFPDLVFGSPAKHPCLLKKVHPLCLFQELSESELAQQRCTPPIIYACMQLLASLFKENKCLTSAPGAQWMTSGVAMGPITSLTVAISSFFSDGGGGYSVPCTHTPFQTCLHQASVQPAHLKQHRPVHTEVKGYDESSL